MHQLRLLESSRHWLSYGYGVGDFVETWVPSIIDLKLVQVQMNCSAWDIILDVDNDTGSALPELWTKSRLINLSDL